jgi:hypothetical protein
MYLKTRNIVCIRRAFSPGTLPSIAETAKMTPRSVRPSLSARRG